MDERHWQRHSYLDVLRPDAGWRVDYAVLTTYSADLIALVTALLALAGIEEDEDSATKVDFANAYEVMRGRLRILVQRGRLASPRRHAPVLSILDRFVREVGSDEAHGSWHPKIALVKFITPEEEDRWRLWVGSRNLTRSTSWEVGLALTGHAGSDGIGIPGVPQLGMELARLAELQGLVPEKVADELDQVRWQVPKETLVHDVQLFPATMRRYPPTPGPLDELIIVSPFLDVTTLRHFGHWGEESTERTLVSLQTQLAAVYGSAPDALSGWRLLHLEPPEPEDIEATEAGEYSPESESNSVHHSGEEQEAGAVETSWEDGVIEPLGLHAKIIYARHRERRLLWLGSANATTRGWRGPNVEVVANLAVSEATASGLQTFVREIARTVDEDALALLASGALVDEDRELLEKVRAEVAARWSVHQERCDGDYLLVATNQPHPADSRIELSVGLLGEEVVLWPRGAAQILLAGRSAIESELVQVRLRRGDLAVTWLQRAPLVPPPTEERDHRALARHLDPRTFLLWIRSLLGGGDPGDGGGTWYATDRRPRGRRDNFIWWAPTLEELLKSWSRRPESLRQVDNKVQQYFSFIREESVPGTSEKERRVIEEFAATWETVRQVLVDEADE